MSMSDMLGSPQVSGRSTMGRTPIYRMALSGSLLDVKVQDATMVMGENTHDTGTLTVSSATMTSTAGILESPISFLYGIAPRTEVFSGYVTSVTEQQTDTGVLTWAMDVVGPTKLMQSGVPRFWTNRTVPAAVETLAYVSYLGYTGHAHTHTWPTLAQTGDSDWQMCVSLATRLGWSVFNRYGIILLYDPMKLFVEQGSIATLISETYTIAKTSINEERALLDFTPAEEAESDAGNQGFKVAYFNNNNLQVALQKGTHSNYQFLTDFVIRNTDEATIYVNSRDSDASNWFQTATARIMGNASIFPGMSVEVLTTNTKYYPGKFNGRWLVLNVQHKMDSQSFQSNLTLARPDGTTLVTASNYLPFWQSLTRARPTLSLSQTMSLQNSLSSVGFSPLPQVTATPTVDAGIWLSSWNNSTVRSVA